MKVAGQSSKTAPALCAFGNGKSLVLAYVANNSTNDLLVTTSSDGGMTWAPSIQVTEAQASKTAPALCTFGNGSLALAYVANDGSNQLLVTISNDGGKKWTPPVKVTGQSSKKAPALSALDGSLVVAYVANNASDDLLFTTSRDGGKTWSPSATVGGQSEPDGPRPAKLRVY